VPSLPISFLVVSWMLMFPLVFFASDGSLWFSSVERNNQLASTYGALILEQTASPGHNIILLLLFAISAAAFFPKIIPVATLFIRDKVFAALVAWAMASCLWSQAPMDSLKTSLYLALNTIFAFYLYRRFTPDQQIRLLLMLGWFCLVLSIVLSLFFPHYGIDQVTGENAWRGMYGHKNLCSMTTSFLLLGGLYSPSKNVLSNIFRVIYVVLSVFLVLMTKSATGKVCLASIFAYYLFNRFISRVRLQERAIVIAVSAFLVVALIVAGFALAPLVASLLGKNLTLTGRTQVWQSVIPAIVNRPIGGYGYSAFWRGYEGASASVIMKNGWSVSSAHNAYLEVALSLGMVGVLLVVCSIVRAGRDAFVCIRAGASPYLAWCGAIVLLTVVTSVDEGQVMIPNNLMWILFILACIGLSEGAKSIRSRPVHG
jgi:exopolysaccharide production protein ExoQ